MPRHRRFDLADLGLPNSSPGFAHLVHSSSDVTVVEVSKSGHDAKFWTRSATGRILAVRRRTRLRRDPFEKLTMMPLDPASRHGQELG